MYKIIKSNLVILLLILFSCKVNDESKVIFYDNTASSGVREKGTLIDNKKNGLWIYVEANGQIIGETYYINDLQEGPSKLYDEMGRIMRNETYHKNKLDGIYENYVDGEIDSRGKFKNGLMEGHWKYYYEGRLARNVEYKNGQPIKTEEILKMPSTGRDLYELLESK